MTGLDPNPLWAGLPDRRHIIRRWHEEGAYGTLTLADAMAEGAKRFPDCQTVFHSDTRPSRATLAEMEAASQQLAGAFHRLGIRQGDVIAIQVPNWLEGMLAYQAAFKLGAVIVPIVHIYGPKEVSFILGASRAKMLIIPDRWRNIDYIERLRTTDLAAVERVIVIGDEAPAGAMTWAQMMALAGDDYPASTAHADEPAVMLYTSGTTSDPKGVVHSHNSLIAANKMYMKWGGWDARTVTLGSGPAGHIGGVLNTIKLFLTGSSTVMLDVWDPYAAAKLIVEYGVNQNNSMPYFLTTMMDAADELGLSLAGIRQCLVGGAGVPPTLIERTDRYGMWVSRSYGSTEVATITACPLGDTLERRAYTDGRANPGGQVRITAEDGRIAGVGEEGEVTLMAPFMFLGYSQKHLNEAAFTEDGWFLSGDIGRLDAEGYLTITDRKKDIIIRGGENISSKEVESVLAAHPAVFESAVTAMPDPALGEKVCAFVVLRQGGSLSLEEVRAHFVAAGIARQKTPERIIVVDEFPRTAGGKVKKFELRKHFSEKAEAP